MGFCLEPFGENATSLLCDIADVSGNPAEKTSDKFEALRQAFQAAFLLVGFALDEGTFISVITDVTVKRKLESGIRGVVFIVPGK